MIEKHEHPDASEVLRSPRHFALKLNHKHVPEMQKVTGLVFPPLFNPIVSNYPQGLAVSIPLFPWLFQRKATAQDIQILLASYYESEPFIRVMPYESDDYLDEGYFDITACNGSNQADIFVFGRDDQVLLLARLDSLWCSRAEHEHNARLPEELGLRLNAGGVKPHHAQRVA